MTDTEEKKRAIAERELFDSAPAEDKKSAHTIGKFIAELDPTTSSRAADLRSRLLLAGERADVFWQQVAVGMPLTTAVRLLREAEHVWRRDCGNRTHEDVIAEVIAAYEKTGHVRRVGDRVFRTRGTPFEREAQIAQGKARKSAPAVTELTHKSKPRGAVREACATWVASILPKNDPRIEGLAHDLVREIDMVLESFSRRLRPEPVMREHLLAACDLLNIPRPKWGRRADQERAWKHRKAALRATHPDALGHEGGRDAFQAINNAYDVVVSYNDNLPNAGGNGGG